MGAMTTTRDPYAVLGVSKSATAAEIKKAYYKLAKQYHPDSNASTKATENKLKEVNAAYDFLSDATKRARYDRGEIDASGQEKIFTHPGFDRGSPFGGGRGGASGAGASGKGGARFFFDENDFTSEDILSELFGGGRKAKKKAAPEPPPPPPERRDITYKLTVPFVEATLGGKRPLKLAGGKEVALTIPAGTVTGTRLRLKGQGERAQDGTVGDAYIDLTVADHPHLTRDGNDISCDVPITLEEAVLGGRIRVPTLSGLVEMKLPKGSNTGTKLRLKGKGVPLKDGAGDQYVRLTVVLPDTPDEALAKFLAARPASDFNPRKKAGLE